MTYALTHCAMRFGLTLLALALAGCSLRPAHAPDTGPIPSAYKHAPAESAGAWTTAQPADDALRGAWWTLFQDPALNALQTAAQDANPTLQAAYARLQLSRAQHRQAQSALFPRLDAGFGPTRLRESPASYSERDDGPASTRTLWRAEAGVAYEADLFGRVSSTINAASAEQARSGALYRLTLLALQADVADTYFLIRELDAQHRIYRQTLDLRERGLALSLMRLEAGGGAELEVERARAELEAARTDALGTQRLRASAEHALAILLGKAPADFSLPPDPLRRMALAIPPGLPSELLERRPDIAAAERAMAAANARIGAARAAFFPRLELTGAAGFESSSLSQLFQWSSRTFLLGPFLGTALSLPILDGGGRQADLDAARAAHEEEAARYRETLLNAFREVEDNLMHLRIMAAQQTAQDRARLAARRSADLSRLQYETGTHTQLDVIDADRNLLQQQLASARLDGDQARTTVRLIRALGGGWDTPLPGAPLSLSQVPAAPAPSPPLPPSPNR